VQSPHSNTPPGREPLLDSPIRVAAVVLFLIAAFSVLIMGIFGAIFETQNLMIVGSCVILSGSAVLLLMIAARLVSRAVAAREGTSRRRTAMVASVAIYCVGGAAIMLGTWQCLKLWTQPVYQEANIEMPNSVPQY
jgi:hypothetical protein